MSPQFVDFDADGKLDIVAGIFDGSPHLARGDGKGWQQPEQILDVNGKRIMLNAFWNFDTKKWDKNTDGNVDGDTNQEGHLTSTVAFDWDGDQDLDLLMGDHRSGHVYRRENNGTAATPKFGTKNLPVLADGKPIDVPGTVATLRLFDWNRDGRMDLLVSGMGDAFSNDGEGGGVYLYLNTGTKTDTKFGPRIELVPPSKKGAVDSPKRPDSGLYVDAGDIDGDGDFDLVVGGYSHWKPTAPTLTDEQKAKAETLKVALDATNEKLDKLNEALSKVIEAATEADRDAKYKEAYASQKDARAALTKERQPLSAELEKLMPNPKRISYVWLYENTSPAAKSN